MRSTVAIREVVGKILGVYREYGIWEVARRSVLVAAKEFGARLFRLRPPGEEFNWVTERIAIGGRIFPDAVERLKAVGVTHVLNLQADFDDRDLSGMENFTYCWIPTRDDWRPKDNNFFDQATEFVLQALRLPDTQVLIHCRDGRHRAPLVCLAVLRKMGYESQEAMRRIRSARSQTEFPRIYLESLEEYFGNRLSDTANKPVKERG